MKRKILAFIAIPLLLTSCASGGVSLSKILEITDAIEEKGEHPYYRVKGILDFNNSITEVDALFDKQPTGHSYVPYARYNEGYYIGFKDREDALIYANASRSYWLRVPLRINKDNFYKYDEQYQEEDDSSAHYQLAHIIRKWMDEGGNTTPSSNKMYYELLSDGGFAIGGRAVHTWFKIDNYPYYPDEGAHPEFEAFCHLDRNDPQYADMDDDEFAEAYQEHEDNMFFSSYESEVNAKVNIRFEYNKDGWLTREYAATLDYNFNKFEARQVYLEARYTYKFSN